VLVLSRSPGPLLHSPRLEPALLTHWHFAGAGLSLAASGPIPRSVDCANVPQEQRPQVLPQLPPAGLTFRDCASLGPREESLGHLRVPVNLKLGWPRDQHDFA
jgi:hypothetical protein